MNDEGKDILKSEREEMAPRRQAMKVRENVMGEDDDPCPVAISYGELVQKVLDLEAMVRSLKAPEKPDITLTESERREADVYIREMMSDTGKSLDQIREMIGEEFGELTTLAAGGLASKAQLQRHDFLMKVYYRLKEKQ